MCNDFQSEDIYGKRDYNIHQYSLNIPQFDKSDEIYHNFWNGYMDLTPLTYTPILVSLPYYKDCDPNSYTGVTFGHASPSVYQLAVEPGKFIVESQTGKTINFTKNYQYNVNNMMPYFNAKKMTPTAIPIVTVMETYVTPDWNFDGDLKAYHDKDRNITIVTIISLVFAALCIVSAIILFRRFVVRRRELSSVVIKCSTQNYSGLYIESDAGNGDSLYSRA